MIQQYNDDVIIACSSSQEINSATALIRISGFFKIEALNNFFSRNFQKILDRQTLYTVLKFNKKIYDYVLVTYFASPKSYSGENMLEISVHGNVLNIKKIIQLFIDEKVCRLALPGEFTYRAVKNKKMNLSQAEGLALLINANSSFVYNQGLAVSNGELHELYTALRDTFLSFKMALELSIDFSEDVGENESKVLIKDKFIKFKDEFVKIFKRTNLIPETIFSPKIVIYGPTNVGKSTLFNFMLGFERAIVNSTPGTTRDFISETLLINNEKFILCDTAGIRKSSDLVEMEGMVKAKELLKNAFYKIMVINPLVVAIDEMRDLLQFKPDFVVFTHSDHDSFDGYVEKLKSKIGPIGPIFEFAPIGPNREFKEILDSISEKLGNLFVENPILIERHRKIIETLFYRINQLETKVEDNDVAITANELNFWGNSLAELIGIISDDELVSSIFKNFCIGK